MDEGVTEVEVVLIEVGVVPVEVGVVPVEVGVVLAEVGVVPGDVAVGMRGEGTVVKPLQTIVIGPDLTKSLVKMFHLMVQM